MPRGKPTPEAVKRFVIDTGRNSPELSYERIVEKVDAQFRFEIDKSTVGKILNREGVHRIRAEVRTEDPIRLSGQVEHEQFLVEGLNQLGPSFLSHELPVYYDRKEPPPGTFQEQWLKSGLEVPDSLKMGCLREHIGTDDDIWALRREWAAASYEYRMSCWRLWCEIVDRSKKYTDLPVLSEYYGPQPLITGTFVESLLEYAGRLVAGSSEDLGDYYAVEPMPDVEGELFRLDFQGGRIAFGSSGEVERAQAVHQDLRKELAGWDLLVEVKVGQQDIRNREKILRDLIELRSLQRSFSGTCRVCEVWH